MTFDLVRGMTLEQVERAYRKLSPEEALDKRWRRGLLPLEPPATSRTTGLSRQRSTLQQAKWEFTKCDAAYGDSYWLVVRAFRKWAPEKIETQDFAVAVTFRASEPFYAQLSARLQERLRAKRRS